MVVSTRNYDIGDLRLLAIGAHVVDIGVLHRLLKSGRRVICLLQEGSIGTLASPTIICPAHQRWSLEEAIPGNGKAALFRRWCILVFESTIRKVCQYSQSMCSAFTPIRSVILQVYLRLAKDSSERASESASFLKRIDGAIVFFV
jgi:hypothetical protein